MKYAQRYGVLRIAYHEATGILQRALYLPEGAEVMEIFHDPSTRSLSLVIQSDDLPEVPEGHESPILNLAYTTKQVQQITDCRIDVTDPYGATR